MTTSIVTDCYRPYRPLEQQCNFYRSYKSSSDEHLQGNDATKMFKYSAVHLLRSLNRKYESTLKLCSASACLLCRLLSHSVYLKPISRLPVCHVRASSPCYMIIYTLYYIRYVYIYIYMYSRQHVIMLFVFGCLLCVQAEHKTASIFFCNCCGDKSFFLADALSAHFNNRKMDRQYFKVGLKGAFSPYARRSLLGTLNYFQIA